MEALIRTEVDDAEEILTGTLPGKVEDADDDANGISTNERTLGALREKLVYDEY